MSQFPGAYQDPFNSSTALPAKTSGLAIAALICSLIFCCPLTTIPGILLGAIAFVTIGSNPMRKGKGLAIAAVLIGVLATAGQGVGWVYVVGMMKQWTRLFETGPSDALTAAFAGNAAGVRNDFYGPGNTASDAEIAKFVAELRVRYGNFQSAKLDHQAQNQGQPPIGQTTLPMPYEFTFEKQKVGGTVDMIIADQKTGKFVWKLGSITVHDTTLGDLTFPAASPAKGGTPAPASSVPATGSP